MVFARSGIILFNLYTYCIQHRKKEAKAFIVVYLKFTPGCVQRKGFQFNTLPPP